MNWKRLGRGRSCPEGIARYIFADGALKIWCQGTETPEEWAWNLDPRIHRQAINRGWNRRDYAQAVAVKDAVLARIPAWAAPEVTCYGYSRGAAIAVILTELFKESGFPVNPPRVFAPKRPGTRKVSTEAIALHHRGDIVPFLPPWYQRYRLVKMGRLTWPWEAHLAMLKVAAVLRNDIGKGLV